MFTGNRRLSFPVLTVIWEWEGGGGGGGDKIAVVRQYYNALSFYRFNKNTVLW